MYATKSLLLLLLHIVTFQMFPINIILKSRPVQLLPKSTNLQVFYLHGHFTGSTSVFFVGERAMQPRHQKTKAH